MNKREIKALHQQAEFQKKLAWANFEASKNSVLFKKELIACAVEASMACRRLRREAMTLIWDI